MDEKAKFALKRDIAKSYVPGPRNDTLSGMIRRAWNFTRRRGVSIQEMMANLPPEAVSGLVADAMELLKDVPDEMVDDEDCGFWDGSIWPPFTWPPDRSDPTFIPYSFVRELASGFPDQGGES